VFETILVIDGQPQHLDDHLERLEASLRELYGVRLTARTVDTAGRPGRSRLRILADPNGETTLDVTRAAPPPHVPRELAPFILSGGLGTHKWQDRSLLAALARHARNETPLIIDADGLVLEASYANVWIIEEGALITPPADGRILPGITRKLLLASEPDKASEQPIDLARLKQADAIFLTSSIAGRHPARLGS
jgi:para-aminobenzoate synthetase/4-amino-4-deoxychorismate lyase